MNIKQHPLSFTFQILLLLSLILAVLYSFSGIFFGLDFTDSFYHLNQALNPADGIFLYPFLLSSVIINEFIDLAGPNIFNLRVINWLILVISMVLPFIVLKVKFRKFVIVLYFIFTLVLYAPFNANILGYDTLSIFINSLIFSFTALYLKDRKSYIILLLALFGAMAIMIRLPNILIIPVIFTFLLVSERINNSKQSLNLFLKPLGFLTLTLLLILSGYAFYYDSFEQFFGASANATSHDFLSLFLNYFRDAIKITGYMILLLSGLYAYQRFNNKISNFLKIGLLIVFFLVILFFLVGVSKFSANYSFFLVAVAISLVAGQIAGHRGKEYSFRDLILYLFLFFIFINPLGSNTGLLKAYSLLLLLPFILSLHKIKYKNYWLILFTILLPFSIITKVFGIYEDRNLSVLNKKLEIEELTPIYTNLERKDYLQKMDILVQNLKTQGVEVFFYGDKSHIFHYLYPETSLNISSFFQPVDNLSYYRDFEENIKNIDRVAVFIVNSYPENSLPELSLFEKQMIQNGFEKRSSGSIEYFLKSEK